MRNIRILKDGWTFTKEGAAQAVTLPHTWNAVDGQDGGNDYYRGVCSYKRTITAEELAGEVNVLEIGGSAHICEVFLNGQLLAHHEGGYSCFRTEIPEPGELKITVDNRNNDTIYPQKADFTFYGGLYREVRLISVPAEHFELLKDGTPGIKVTPMVDLANDRAEVTVETWQNAEEVVMEVGGETRTAVSVDGHAQAVFTIENVHLWDGLNDPYLYTASACLKSGDKVETRFGCREFHIDPEKGFFLNGRSYPLRGVSRHQDRKGSGNAVSRKEIEEDMAIIRELGANTLRLAHYQHSQEFYDLCDENGLVIWAEIPYITMHMPGGRENTLSQMKDLITQCYNHPSIVVWGLSNEITAASSVDEDLLENHRLLNELCHEMDPTRLTTMANVFMLEIESPILEIPDVNSYNLYFGWYLGDLKQNDEFFDEYHAKYPERAIGFSEYGADANPAYHSSHPERSDYTEEYQCVYHEHMLKMIDERPYLWATHVWNLFDFAADGRDEGGKHGENQKGLVTFDRRYKKDAFYLYKAAWSKEPFVHLCSKGYVNRAEDQTQIKVYSNQPAIRLYKDGELVEEKEGARVFTFDVPITAEHVFTACAGELSDTMTVRKVEEMDASYVYGEIRSVTNWFDEEIDPAYYSVEDTLGELQADERAGAVVKAMMDKASQSRGDVADAVKDNPGLVRMMSRMTLISLLKQGGADEESVRQLNRVLQGFKK